MADTRFTITKLNNNNFQVWKTRVELLLIKEDLWYTINNDKPEGAGEKWHKADGQAKATIGLLIEDDQLRHIKNSRSAKEAWEALKNYHQKASLSNQVFLLKRICNLKLTEYGDMEKHIYEMLNLVDQLAALGEVLKDKLIIAILLSSLPESFHALITTLETRNETDLTLELVKGKLIEEATRRKHLKENSGENDLALKVCHKSAMEIKKPKETACDVYTCFFCKKPGHIKKNCIKYKKWKSKGNSQQKVSQVTIKEANERNICFNVVDKDLNTTNDWYIDSGATSHMSNNLDFFETFKACHHENVRLANGSLVEVQGKGNVKLLCENAKGEPIIITIKNVCYIPALKENLISVKRMTENNLNVTFSDKECIISQGNRIITKAMLCGNLYKLKYFHKALSATNQLHSSECQHTWHRKLGHRNFEDINKMILKGIIEGVKIKDCGLREVCDVCQKGKMTRRPFPQRSICKSQSTLDLIHSDFCGPMECITPGQKRYILTLIDDYSRYTFIYLLSHKSEVSIKIKEFLQYVKTMFNKVPKIFRSDRGTEYINHEIKELFNKEGIKSQYTVAYTPEQNGVAERKNRSLIEMSRCLLIDAGLNRKYWGEAVNYANYLQNRLFTRATEISPIEKWEGTKPNLKDVHIFGSKVYVHIPKELRRKLDDKAKELIFVGFDENSKGYRLLDTHTNRIIISRDVKFTDESSQEKEETSPDKNEDDAVDNKVEVMNKQIVNSSDELSNEETEGEEDILTPSRGRGRPRIIRTGSRGRPRKMYHEAHHQGEVNNYAGYVTEIPVKTALHGPEANDWTLAMIKEIQSMLEKDVWDLVERPVGRNVIGCRMILSRKHDTNGNLNEKKARLVARGFSQRPGIDFGETFAPVARISSIRLAAAIAAHYQMSIHHVDITTAYLHGSLDEEIYMETPENLQIILVRLIQLEMKKSLIKRRALQMLKDIQSGNKVCRLKKAIYGLKQAGRKWHERLNKELLLIGLITTNFDPCVYYQDRGEDMLMAVVYVDDILIIAKDTKKIQILKDQLSKAFTVKELGNVKYCLGIEFSISEEKVTLSQGTYIKEVLKRFEMTDANPIKTPLEVGLKLSKESQIDDTTEKRYPYRELVGSLMYLAVITRPDIAHAVSLLSQFNNCYGQIHWEAAKRVLRYIKGTIDYSLEYKRGNAYLEGFTDADWGSCIDDRHSFTGYVFYFNGSPIMWESRKQRTVALSTTEAEYVAITDACKEAIFLLDTFTEMGVKFGSDLIIFNDNASALKLAKNPVYHARTKHIAVRHHFIRDLLKEGKIKLKYRCTDEMIADILTKGLNGPKNCKFVKLLGLSG